MRRTIQCAVAAAMLLPAAAGAAAGEAPDWDRWRRIELVVRDSLLLGGRFELVRDARGELTRLETAASARLLGARVARTRSTSVLDERLGRTTSHVRLSKRRGRRFEFDGTGYDVTKLRADRFETEVARWEVVHTTRFDDVLPPAGSAGDAPPEAEGRTLLDVYGLLLHLRFRDLDGIGDRARIRVGSKRGPVIYEAVVIERRRATRRIRLGGGGRRAPLELDELRLALRTVGGDDDESGFMGMEGETELWVEAGSKAPVEIIGRVPGAGRVSLSLDRLDAPPLPR